MSEVKVVWVLLMMTIFCMIIADSQLGSRIEKLEEILHDPRTK